MYNEHRTIGDAFISTRRTSGTSTVFELGTNHKIKVQMKSLMVVNRLMKNIPQLVRREPCFLLAEILLTYQCNQRCLQCNYPQRVKGMPAIDLEDFKTIIDHLDDFGTQGILLTGGEPMLHPHLIECLEYVMQKNFTYVQLLTNLYYSRKKLERLLHTIFKHKISLSCSFDGLGDVADSIRGAEDVSRTIMENMEFLDRENNRRGRPIYTGANIVFSQLNLHQIPALLSYLERLHWPVDIDVYRTSHRPDGDRLRITNLEQLRAALAYARKSPAVFTPRWIIDGFMDSMLGNAPKYCPYLLSPSIGSRIFIHPNGEVKVCIGDPVGNLLTQSPREILKSDAWRAKRIEFEACPGCWNGCYTIFSKLSRYGLGEITRSIRLFSYYRDFQPVPEHAELSDQASSAG